ncbi:glutamate transport system permease protein [Spinactinospora alkalitolerans]|uniref:Glutamate transport system permease protein n=1 Tax=Spinactinospora alkalitolerans TaxID=687207 RepID=A0A852U4U4_9ACTN|nr:amino acid ABC transporter permease [Spinactinospora alkalitolerans]NYE49114.1 glutamate transport system permease protein [Spinactinospora alkalitolerans]
MKLAQQNETSRLFDAPGPKAKARQGVYTVVTLIVFAAALLWVYLQLDEQGQWDAAKWEPFLRPETWTAYVVPGMLNTLSAALQAAVLAIVFGLVFGIGRLSEHWWIRVPCGAVVEFFRGIPLLMMIFFLLALPLAINQLTGLPASSFRVEPLMAVVVGLTLYNGSVLAEVFRAGINAVPKGQSEAAYSLGMNKRKVMSLILVPQAVTSMMPAIVAQLVVLLKDSALGYIVSFPELLRNFSLIGTRFNSVIPAAIVCAIIYIVINISLSRVAIWLERRNARRGRASAHIGEAAMTEEAVAGVTASGNIGTVELHEPDRRERPDGPDRSDPDRPA